MLTRRALTIAATVATAVGLVLAVPSPASAGGQCNPTTDPWCSADGGASGSPGGGGSGGTDGGGGCTWNGTSVACTDPEYGSYLGGGCYWQRLDPQPVLSPPAGQDSGSGSWGIKSCYTSPGSGVVRQSYYWLGNGRAAPSPQQLAERALAKVHLLGAQIGVAPRPQGSGAVGLPVWLWTAVSPGTWGPLSASARAGGVTVTIAAKATRIVWDMGDGTQVSCSNPGTPYQARYGMATSPTCGYVYTRPSSTPDHRHGRYTITATTYWTVTWSGGGQSGVLHPTSKSRTSVEIGEIQVVGQ